MVAENVRVNRELVLRLALSLLFGTCRGSGSLQGQKARIKKSVDVESNLRSERAWLERQAGTTKCFVKMQQQSFQREGQ